MDFSPFKSQMEKAVEFLKTELKSIQVGKASIAMVDNINVQTSYGIMKVPQLAHVTIMDSNTIKVEPWDKKEAKNIEKGIYDADLGITPKNEGDYVLVKVPEITKERREEIAKQVKSMGEDAKAQIRRVRHDAQKENKKLLEAKEVSENEHENNEAEIDTITKSMNTQIEDIVEAKAASIMEV